MKRSKALTLTGLMAGASLTVSACGDGSPAQWNQDSVAQKDPVPAFAYQSLEQCKAANEVSDADCDTNYQRAIKDDETNAPRFSERATCEDTYGAGNCVPKSASNGGGSFFTPLLAGFVIGRMLDGGGSPYYRGTGLYRQRDGYSTGFGGTLGRDYASGRTTIGRQGVDPSPAVRQAPARVQTRSAVISRGGFGGGGRSFGG